MRLVYPIAIKWLANRWLKSLGAVTRHKWNHHKSVELDKAQAIVEIMGKN